MDWVSEKSISGVYFDGRQPRRWQVTVSVEQQGLKLLKEDGTVVLWLHGSFSRASGAYTDEQLRLERGDEVLVASSPELLALLGQRRSSRLKYAALAAGSLASALLMAYLWGVPLLSGVAAKRVPLSWEESLGKGASEKLAPLDQRCTDEEANAAVQAIAERLLSGQPPTAYRIRTVIARDSRINAFAAPGGYIIILSGLLAQTRRAEELAGVLAHELAHVVERHPTQGIIRALSTGTMLSVIAGDFSTLSGMAASLTTLRYNRHDEQAADLRGLDLLVASGLDPQGMVDVFQSLKQHEGDGTASLEFLSSHPLTDKRIAQLQEETLRRAGRQTAPLLPQTNWSQIRRACEPKPQ